MVDIIRPLARKAGQEIRKEVSKEHEVSADVDRGWIELGVEAGVQLPLRGTDDHEELVLENSRRAALEAANPNMRWVASRLQLGGGVSGSSGPVSFGFSGSVESRVVTAHELDERDLKGRAANMGAAIRNQVRAMPLPATAATALRADASLPAGTEWTFKGKAKASMGAGPSWEAGGRWASAEAGIGAGAKVEQVFTKNVELLGNGRVEVSIARDRSTSLGVEAKAGFELGPLDSGVKAGSEMAWSRQLIGSAVLQLPQQAEHYNQLLQLEPEQASQYIRDHRLGQTLQGRAAGQVDGFELELFNTDLASASRRVGHSTAFITDASGATTRVVEGRVEQEVDGFFPKVLAGQGGEREIAHLVQQEPGRAPEHQFGVRHEDRISRGERKEVAVFAKAMGGAVEVSKRRVEARLGLSHAQLGVLKTATAQQVLNAFAIAQAQIEQSPTLPGWATNPRDFELANKHLSQNPGATVEPEERSYRQKFKRSLREDRAGWNAANDLAEGIASLNPSRDSEGSVLYTRLNELNDAHLRISLLTITRLLGERGAGASMPSMEELQDRVRNPVR